MGVRSSRLFALVMALPRSGLVTAEVMAGRLEVSVRTIYRDVRALEEAGVPIRTVGGPDGGIGLVAGWRSPLDVLTADEAHALLIGGAGADLGLGGLLATARSKVRSGLPSQVRGQLDGVAERFLLDTSGWFRGDEPSEHLRGVATALWSSRRLDVRYARGGRAVRRRVDPLGLVLKAGRWYLVAAHRGRPRTYRVDRIVGASPLPERAARPDDFDLERYWSEAAVAFARDLQRTPTRLRLPSARLPDLRAAVPGPVTAEATDAARPDGERVVVDLAVESLDVAVVQLLGVPDVEVLEPMALRHALAERARRLSELNGPTG